jgi:putative CocE/NonD family hydrolase
MTDRCSIVILTFVVWLCATAPPRAQAPRPPSPSGRMECSQVLVPMRDGVKLATDVYTPAGSGPWPVIVERTPYGKGHCDSDDARYFARRGYVAIRQDERGRYDSEGLYYWWGGDGAKGLDGHDTIEWAATQPWSTGKVGTMGLSAGCHNQYLTATTMPPHLAAMFCADAAGNQYKYLMYQGGALHMIMPTWLISQNEMVRPVPLAAARTGGYVGSLETWTDWWLKKQQRGASVEGSMFGEMMRDLVRNPHYNDYWKQYAVDERMDKINVPIFHFAAWYDRYPLTQLKLFNGIREKGGPLARPNQRIQFGPWTHGSDEIMPRVIGDLDFGDAAAIDYNALRLRWFEAYLKGIDNGLMKEPPVHLFVMGANTWRSEKEFPLARTVYTDYYLRTGPSGSIDSLNDGALSQEKPASDKADSYQYDPAKPVPSIGADLFIEPNGARDHRPADRRSLTFTTSPLAADTEITGIPKVDLYASSTAVDTDWVVAISDVHPDGYSQILRQNLLRARFRDGFEKPVLMKPGQIYPFAIEMFPISNVFKKGHRIRVTVASSSFPKWYPNGNTGKEMDEETAFVVATNTVYHDAAHPSRIVLPIIPGGAATSSNQPQ